jgi:archaellin
MAIFLCVLSLLLAAPGTKLTVQVNSATTGKPIDRASVIIHFKHGRNPVNMKKIRTSWETKTNQQGSVSVPEIPMGEITVQVIAQHYQTFGGVFQLEEPEQTITVKLNAPQAQYSEQAQKP